MTADFRKKTLPDQPYSSSHNDIISDNSKYFYSTFHGRAVEIAKEVCKPGMRNKNVTEEFFDMSYIIGNATQRLPAISDSRSGKHTNRNIATKGLTENSK